MSQQVKCKICGETVDTDQAVLQNKQKQHWECLLCIEEKFDPAEDHEDEPEEDGQWRD